MKRLSVTTLLIAFGMFVTFASNATSQAITDGQGDVGIGTFAPHPTALLDLTSTSKGFLIPRMTEAQRDAIAGPAESLMIFNTTTGEFNYWDANTNQWEIFITSANIGNFAWLIDGNTGLTAWNGVTGNFLGHTDNVDLVLKTESADMEFWTNNTHRATLNSSGNLHPATDNSYTLGTDALRWADVYANGGSVHVGPSGGEAGSNELEISYSGGSGMLNVGGGSEEIEIDDPGNIIRFDPDGDGTLTAFVRNDGIGVNTGPGTDILIQQDGLRRNGGAIESYTFSNTAGDLDVNVNGDLNVLQNATLGDNTASDVHTLNGVTTFNESGGNNAANINESNNGNGLNIFELNQGHGINVSENGGGDALVINETGAGDGASITVDGGSIGLEVNGGPIHGNARANILGDNTDNTQLTIDGVVGVGNYELVVDGDASVSGSLALPLLSPGSVTFINGANQLDEDNANFFWDQASAELGIGTNSPSGRLDVVGDGANPAVEVSNSGGVIGVESTVDGGSGLILGSVPAVHGDNDDETGVAGTSGTGVGVFGASNSNHGVNGLALIGGVGGVFGRNDAAGGYGVFGTSVGGGTGVYGVSSTGISGRFDISNGASSADVVEINNAGTGLGIDLNGGELDGDDQGNALGDGSAAQQLTVRGSSDAVIGNTLVGNPTVWDLVVQGDQVTTGIIKAGGSVWIDGSSAGNHQISANDNFDIQTQTANPLSLSTNNTTAVVVNGTNQNVNILNNLDVDGSANVDGPATLQSTLLVQGITTLNSNLNVNGPTDLNSTLNVDGAVTINNTITQTGGGPVSFSGNVDADNGLDVSGQDLTIDASVSLQGPGSGHNLGTLGTDAEVLTIDGLAFNVPDYELIVNGDVQINGLLSLGGLSPNSVVVTDAAGNLNTDNPPLGYNSTTDILTTPDVLPNADNTYTLGSNAVRWADVFVEGSSVHIGDAVGTEMLLGYSGNQGTVNVDGGSPEVEIDAGAGIIRWDPDGDGSLNASLNSSRFSINTGGGADLFISQSSIERNNAADQTLSLQNTGAGDLNVSVDGDISVDGNATLGNSPSTDLHTVNGQMTVNEAGPGRGIIVNESGSGSGILVQESGNNHGIRIVADATGSGLVVDGSNIDGNGSGNELGDGTAVTQLTINGVQDATGAETLPNAAFDLAVTGDIGATGIIKSGASIVVDGVSNPRVVSSDAQLNLTTSAGNINVNPAGGTLFVNAPTLNQNSGMFTVTAGSLTYSPSFFSVSGGAPAPTLSMGLPAFPNRFSVSPAGGIQYNGSAPIPLFRVTPAGTLTASGSGNSIGSGSGGTQLTVNGDGANNPGNGFELDVEGDANIDGTMQAATIGISGLTPGSVTFINSSNQLDEDNANFFWDETNARLGIGNNAPSAPLDVVGDNTNPAIEATNNTTEVIVATRDGGTGLGLSVAPAILGDNGNGAGVAGIGDGGVLNPGVFGTVAAAASGDGVWGTGRGSSFAGVRGRNDDAGGYGVIGQSNGTGAGGLFSTSGGTMNTVQIDDASSGDALEVNASAGGLGIDLNGGALNGDAAGNALGDGTAVTQLTINGVQDATGAETLPNAAFDLAVTGDIGATGMIKSGASVLIDGVSATRRVSSDDELEIQTTTNNMTLDPAGTLFIDAPVSPTAGALTLVGPVTQNGGPFNVNTNNDGNVDLQVNGTTINMDGNSDGTNDLIVGPGVTLPTLGGGGDQSLYVDNTGLVNASAGTTAQNASGIYSGSVDIAAPNAGGTEVINDPNVTANSVIVITRFSAGGGQLSHHISAINPNTSFTVQFSAALTAGDDVNYIIINP